MTNQVKQVVVVAVDFMESGDDALQLGLTMLVQGNVAALHLIHVLDPRDVIDSPEKRALETEYEMVEDTPRRLLARAEQIATLQAISTQGLSVRAHARIGSPVPTLIQTCVDYDADLLIVGTHARQGLERLVLGSVAEQLVRTAPCPVLVARPKDYSGHVRTALPDAPYAAGQAPAQGREVPFERTISTSSDGWRPSDAGPTGQRIV